MLQHTSGLVLTITNVQPFESCQQARTMLYCEQCCAAPCCQQGCSTINTVTACYNIQFLLAEVASPRKHPLPRPIIHSLKITPLVSFLQVFNALGDDTPRIIGEIAFQLERRIILHVFPDADQMYYGTLNDIRRVIGSEPDVEMRARYARALHCRMQRLEPLGWDMNYHVDLGNRIMAKYGVGAPAFFYEERDPLEVHAQLARLTAKLPLVERIGMMTILSGLLSLALEDKRTLFLTTEGEEFEFI